MTDRDTIFALSSGRGIAGVAVIRISGPEAGTVLDRMAGPRPKPRFAAFRRVRHPHTGELLDEALALWFPGPKSETGDDMAELQVHGGAAVLAAVLGAIGSLRGCRPATAGEFARRAFEAGKVDLTAVEGLADLVHAETDGQRRLALVQAGGALARTYAAWRERIIAARALAEAAIDFADEADVAADALTQARAQAKALAGELQAHLADGHRGEIVRDGFRVVLAGPPNVGKSSLINALARRDVAIVSPEAGTTRDVLEVRLDLGGYAVILADTAGIREAGSGVEREGIRRTLGRVREADLVIWMLDAVAPDPVRPDGLDAARTLTVMNKIDLAPAASRDGALSISAVTGEGLAELTAVLADQVARRLDGGRGLEGVITQARHRAAIEAAHAALLRALAVGEATPELMAEELRAASDAVGQVVGKVGVEDVLDQVFGRFCIGK